MHILPDLPYSYDALSPAISEDIMRLHHTKHHQAYIDKLNSVLAEYGIENQSIETLLRNIPRLPEGARQAVINQGGGHYNHSLFWQWMSPDGGGQPRGQLARDIDIRYGSFQGLVDQFGQRALSVFGSGWVWLMPDLEIEMTQNQDNPIIRGAEAPILGLDVWEHAYYLDYQNRRADYVKAWWDIVDWRKVENSYTTGV